MNWLNIYICNSCYYFNFLRLFLWISSDLYFIIIFDGDTGNYDSNDRRLRGDVKVQRGLTLKMYLIRTKSNVCKFTGIVFRCLQDADNNKYVCRYVGVKNDNLNQKWTFKGKFLLSSTIRSTKVQNKGLLD